MSAISKAVMRALAGVARRRAQRMALQGLMGLSPSVLDDLGINRFTLAADRYRLSDNADRSPSEARHGFEDGRHRCEAPARTSA